MDLALSTRGGKEILIVISSYFQLKKLLFFGKIGTGSLQLSPVQDGQTHIY